MPSNRMSVPREQRVSEILDAATAEFAASGFEATTVGSIARRAEMTGANVHYYFATKEDLFTAVVERLYDRLLDALGAELDPLQRLHGYLEFHLERRGGRAHFLAQAATNDDLARVVKRRDAWVSTTVAEITSDRLDAATIEAVVTGLIETAQPGSDQHAVLDHAVQVVSRRRRRH